MRLSQHPSILPSWKWLHPRAVAVFQQTYRDVLAQLEDSQPTKAECRKQKLHHWAEAMQVKEYSREWAISRGTEYAYKAFEYS